MTSTWQSPLWPQGAPSWRLSLAHWSTQYSMSELLRATKLQIRWNWCCNKRIMRCWLLWMLNTFYKVKRISVDIWCFCIWVLQCWKMTSTHWECRSKDCRDSEAGWRRSWVGRVTCRSVGRVGLPGGWLGNSIYKDCYWCGVHAFGLG